ncbi:uncharacterized protein LOC132706497 [Cylas formicarius]|uniref:uncharacterized protein LOC132706497 n=1 Tax=Cylas formicarius TaxID=197179 RepID=UPI002958A188|nr:uncharacterized protein LOC132706497 [Cylas formicarius]
MKFIKSATTYPGADVNSDHNPVVINLQLRYFTRVQRPNKRKRIDVKKLVDPDIRAKATESLEARLQTINNYNDEDVEPRWTVLKKALLDTQEIDIGYVQASKKQQWMTDKILKLMDERRKYKTTDINRYRELNRAVRSECRKAKEGWLAEKCSEMEALQNKHDSFNLHKKIKEFTNTQRKQIRGILKDTNNKILVSVEEKIKRWKEYVETLFNDARPYQAPLDHDLNEPSPVITIEEVRRAIKIQKNDKAVGPDQIHAETLRLIVDADDTGLKLLTSLFNSIYEAGNLPTDWLRSTFITLPKKPNASQCDDHRMISLMSHVLKVFLRIVHTRIYAKCERQVGGTQFGFRNGVGTREALFSLNVLT